MAIVCAVGFAGCGGSQPAADAPAPAAVTEISKTPAEPRQIELSEPVAHVKPPDMIQFEVKYKFTSGKPQFHYLCEIVFDNGVHRAEKIINSWELQESGTIKDLVILDKPVKEMQIKVSEAVKPEEGYDLISNVAKGEVKPE